MLLTHKFHFTVGASTTATCSHIAASQTIHSVNMPCVGITLFQCLHRDLKTFHFFTDDDESDCLDLGCSDKSLCKRSRLRICSISLIGIRWSSGRYEPLHPSCVDYYYMFDDVLNFLKSDNDTTSFVDDFFVALERDIVDLRIKYVSRESSVYGQEWIMNETGDTPSNS
uniref:AlNc14C121G6664 protein n=1 Tax=Albugo laibachii Nc14 TaxID=890382 RepID=F0WJD6_9STRA|nr:AlNc14C121G6664 [Albugo laibachii Nc14]|eukprot:CCA21384.1 AlNc14C121G6664 [Albugo laibachii Nc14]